ncbi:MAG: WD40/YVTN/BNR-like repeat-containing protein [Flavicella sp.]
MTKNNFNVRALEINENHIIAGTSNGEVYLMDLENEKELINIDIKTKEDSVKNNFRAVAYQNKNTFAVSIENPARLYKNGLLVYKESHPTVFYNSMAFWNDEEGIAMGDATDNCLSIIITRDGGTTWEKLSCENFPQGDGTESAFAASNSNIKIRGDKVWIATGGFKSNIYFSHDKGHTWKIIKTPITQGQETTGIYAIDFYDDNHGFAIGGDYERPDINSKNKIKTIDGGKTWKVVAENKFPGYRSCVQYIPNSNANKVVAVGFKGIAYSKDNGATWEEVSKESFYTIRFLNDTIAYAAGKGRISKLKFDL